MPVALALLVAVLGALVGAAAVVALLRGRPPAADPALATAREQAARAEALHAAARAEVAQVRGHVAEERARGEAALAAAQQAVAAERARADALAAELLATERGLAQVEADLAAERVLATEKLALLTRAQDDLTETFRAASAAALDSAGETFLRLAEQRLAQASASGGADLAARAAAVDRMVAPIGASLGRVEARLAELERERAASNATLLEQVRAMGEAQERLRSETANLVTALRSPGTRGRWGELQLRRVVELAGLVRHCDFDEQVVGAGPDGGVRPDVVVRLPRGLSVVVDAKVPLDGYLRALDATDDAGRKAALVAHARQLRTHVDALAAKGYWRAFEPSPEAVVLFLPGEPILAAAAEADPGLFEHAATRNVVLASPSTLILLLRTVAFAWRQEAVTDNARRISELGRELHRRLGTMAEHLDRTGRALDRAVLAYNEGVGSLESRVLVTARRLADLDLVEGELEAPAPVTRDARRLSAPELTRPLALLGAAGELPPSGPEDEDRHPRSA